ncbi:hypothetical protein BMS3Bbin08_00819 [bacterium BMS3Bbin08]|nr:hypothetical protein BMS3Bbin08_00819 [bacterium BMS3Bbin08]
MLNLKNREEVSRYLRAIVESEFFLGKDKFLPLLEQVKTTMEAVTCALGFEKETLLYFYVLRDVVGEKDIVGSIIEEEKTHIRQLSEMKRELGTGE